MRVNGFRCDACCKEHLLEGMSTMRDLSEEFPNDWFILYQGKVGHGKEPLTFCSATCVSDWAEKQNILAREPKEVIPDASDKTHWENW